MPSTPSVNSLFTSTLTSAGITPNAMDAFAAPQVLTTSGSTPDLLGAGNQPALLTTTGTSSGTPASFVSTSTGGAPSEGAAEEGGRQLETEEKEKEDAR